MNITDALGFQYGERVAIVGAGGKTTVLFQLARELTERGLKVLSTTTTRMAADERHNAPVAVTWAHQATLPELLNKHRHVLLYNRIEGEKLRGFSPGWVDAHLAAPSGWDVLLIEADGARRLSFKGPYKHEPAIPADITLVIAVVGASVLGKPLNADYVYGAERIRQTFKLRPDTPVTPELLSATIIHPNLGRKNTSARSRLAVILNQAESVPGGIDALKPVANHILTDYHFGQVLLADVNRTNNPVHEVHTRIGAVIMAAGQSTRMGEPKMLLPWGQNDDSVIRSVCSTVGRSSVSEVAVVTGGLHRSIAKEITGVRGARAVFNSRYLTGDMISSMQRGLQAIWNTCDACLIALGDQPLLTVNLIEQLLTAYRRVTASIVAPSYNNRRGHPMIIHRSLWPSFMEMPNGTTPREVIRRFDDQIYYVLVDTPAVLHDMDTPDEYRDLRRGQLGED